MSSEEKDAARAVSQEILGELQKEKPNRSLLAIKAEGLEKAATTVQSVAPKVLAIALQIAAFIYAVAQLAGHK